LVVQVLQVTFVILKSMGFERISSLWPWHLHKHNIHVTFRALYLFRVNGSQLVHCISLVWRNLVVLQYIDHLNQRMKVINRTMLRNVIRLLGPCHSWQTKALPVASVQPLLFPSSSMDTKVFVALMKGPGKWKTTPNLLWHSMDSDFDTFRFSFSNKTFEWSVSEVVRKSFIFRTYPLGRGYIDRHKVTTTENRQSVMHVLFIAVCTSPSSNLRDVGATPGKVKSHKSSSDTLPSSVIVA